MESDKNQDSTNAAAKSNQEKNENLWQDVRAHLSQDQFDFTDAEIDKECQTVQDAFEEAKDKHEPKQAVGVIFIPTCQHIFVVHTLTPSEFMKHQKALADAKAGKLGGSIGTFVQVSLDYPRLNISELKEGSQTMRGGHLAALAMQVGRFSGFTEEGEIKNY